MEPEEKRNASPAWPRRRGGGWGAWPQADLKPSKVGQIFLNWLEWRWELELALAPAHADQLDCEEAFLCFFFFFFFCDCVLERVSVSWPLLWCVRLWHLSCLLFIVCFLDVLLYVWINLHSVLTNFAFLLQNCVKSFFFLLHSHTKHHKSCCTNSIWHIWRMIFLTGYPIRRTSEARSDCSR